MLKKLFILVVVYWVIIPVVGFAQNKTNTAPPDNFILSAQGHYGYIISHRNNMANLIKGHIYGGELNYIFRTDGCKPWQQTHNYPEIGMCYLHLYLANPQQLGNLDALYPYANIRFNNINQKVAFNLRLGLGLAYIGRPFDRIENHQNEAIGSHLNGFVNLRLNWNIMLSPAWRLDAGVGLTHASNGAFKTPNLGLNMATLNLGLGYAFGNKDCVYKKDSIPPFVRKWEPSIIAITGMKQLEDPDGPDYMVYGLQANIYRTLNYKNKIGGGVEMSYNTATKAVWAHDSVYTNKFGDIAQAGAKLSYAFNFHRVSLPVDFGMYFFKKQPHNGNFFHRIGIRYMATEHIIVNVTLLTHWAKADYFEWGLGYKF